MASNATSGSLIRRAYVVGLLAYLVHISTSEENCTEEYSYYATKTAYETSRWREPVERDPTCTVKASWTLARHAFRYDRVTDQEQKLSKLRDDIIANAQQGSLCQAGLDGLSSWTLRMTPDDDMKQSESGWDELRNVGSRLKERYPSLFESYDSDLYELKHSNVSGDRTRDSARAWAEGVFGTYEGVKLVESGEPDWLFRFYSYCDRYKKEVGDVEVEEAVLFRSGPEMSAALTDTARLLGLSDHYFDYDLLHEVYEMCRLESGIYGNSSWCLVLAPQVLKVLEFEEDIYWYWKDSYAHEINYEQTCSLVVDAMNLIQTIAETGEGKVAVANFGHSPTLNGFYARVGLYRDEAHLKADGFRRQEDRHFRLSLHTPMSANLVLVLSTCASGPVVEAFVNEEATVIPGCDVHQCPYERLVALWQPIVDGCDMEEICKVASRAPVHYTVPVYALLFLLYACV